MSDRIRRILSRDCGAFWQFVKYAAIGVLATAVQTAVFYLLAATCLKCLEGGDWAVKWLGFPAAAGVSDAARAIRFAAATAAGFAVSNVFCWLMDRWFVFTPGKYRWYRELAYFFAVSGFAMLLATLTGSVLIARFGMMTTLAVAVEVLLSFAVNYAMRKFFIFRG